MNKLIVFLFVISVIGVLLYVRLRPYINLARRFFGAVRAARRMSERGPAGAPRPEPRRVGEKLARCPTCGTWFPASGAITFRGDQAKYCSHACLERAAERPHRSHKSAM